MAVIRHLLSGFLGGELDPLMSGRVDTDNYTYGLSVCENFAALALGPLVKRSGFEFICDAAPSARWLSPFKFSIQQEYVIEWSDGKARFFTNGGRIQTGPDAPYELSVPYTAVQAPALSTQQSFDRLYIDHPDYPPASLARTSAITFSFASLELLNGPFKDTNVDEAVRIVADAATGAVNLTATGTIFAAGQIGALLRIEARDFSDIKAWEPGMENIVAGEILRSDGKAYKALTSGTTGSIQPTHTSGAEWDGALKTDALNEKGPYGVQWEYRHDRFGIVRITGVSSGTTAAATVLRRLPDSLTSVPTWRWAHAAFSAAEGWPSLVTLWKGRQVHFKDFDMIASVVGDFGGGRVNFQSFTSSGALASDLAFRRTLATEDPPLWVTADLKLIVGTASRELAIGPTNAQAAVSGDNISADPQSFYGSQPIRPVQAGVQTIFVERGGRRLRSAGYDFARDRYAADDLTAASRQVTQSGVVQLAYSRVPWAMLYAVRGDGQIAVHSDTKLDVKGFARIKLGGDARAISAVSVVGEDGVTDELWLLVERQRQDGFKREIWRQMPWRELGQQATESFYVDGGARVSAAAGQTTFTGLTHLAGQAVAVLAAGGVIPGLTVSNAGELVLPVSAVPRVAYTLIVGLPYTATAVTLQPEMRTQRGTMQGLLQRARKVMLRLLETLGLSVGGTAPGDPLEEVIDRSAADLMDQPIPLFSGDTQGGIDTGFERDGRVRFVSDVPLPAIITAAMLSMEFDQDDA